MKYTNVTSKILKELEQLMFETAKKRKEVVRKVKDQWEFINISAVEVELKQRKIMMKHREEAEEYAYFMIKAIRKHKRIEKSKPKERINN